MTCSKPLILFLAIAAGWTRLHANAGTLVHDSIVDPLAHNFPSATFSVATVHGVTFQQDGVTTYKGWQYATYYQGNLSNSTGKVAVARRPLPYGSWETLVLNDYTFSTVDSHNDVVLGICPGDGSIHLSFDHHVNDLNYRVSLPGVANDPASVSWTPALFGPVTDRLTGSSVMTRVTYPRFIPTPSGKLLFTYRFGGSGGGDEILYEYDGATRAWSLVGQYTSRSGSYTGTFASGTDRNGYFDNTLFDTNGRLHATWCWRETTDASSNHDLLYAYSDDVGRTWKNQFGVTVATSGSTYLSVASPGIIGWAIPQRRNYINNSAMTVDRQGRVHVVAWHLPDSSPDQAFSTSLNSGARFIHYWRGTDGTWRKNQTTLSGTRAKLSADDDGRLFLVYGDATNIRIAAANPAADPESAPASSWNDWSPLSLSGALPSGRANTVNIITDTARWEADRIVSVYAQETNISGTAPTPLHILDYHVSRAAVLPTPHHEADAVETSPTLTWIAGQQAVRHDVYFGTDEAAITTATPSSPSYLGRQSPANRSLGPLLPATTYFWRVDSLDSSDNPTKGRVWSFTTDSLMPSITQEPATRSYGGRTQFQVTIQLRDPLLATGNLTLHVGATDAATAANAWQQTIDLGAKASGSQQVVVDGLENSGMLFYRFRIATVHGETWATNTGMIGATEDLSGWAKSAILDASGYAAVENLTDFPVLIRLSPATLPGFTYDGMLSPPYGDLRFSTLDGSRILSHEVERWVTSGTSLIWVKLPQLASGTRFRVWWGRAGVSPPASAPTWSAFNGVWHLDPALGFSIDSSPSGQVGTSTGLSTSAQSAIPGSADFNGSSSAVAITNSPALNPSLISVEAWVKTTSGAGTPSIFSKDQTTTPQNRVWQFRLNAGKPEFLPFSASANTNVASPDPIHDGQFHHLCGTWDGSTARIYVDGILKNSVPFSGVLRNNQSNRAFIGRSENTLPNYFTGTIDEVRLSPVARSGNWVRASFDNQKPGSTFLTAGETSAPDVDADQLPDSWEMRHFNTIHRTTADSDGDGRPDFLEFAQGTLPTSGSDIWGMMIPASGLAPHEFIYHQIAGGTGNIGTTYHASGVQYLVEVSQDFETWFSGPTHVRWSTRRESLPDGIERVGIHIISPMLQGASPVFARLRVQSAE